MTHRFHDLVTPRRLLLAGLLLCLLGGFVWSRFAWRQEAIRGDEPHYLLIADSLLQDGDLDVKNQYQRVINHPDPGVAIQPQGHVFNPDPQAAHWYSVHGPLMPALIAPAYKLFGVSGATLVMLLLGVGVQALAYRWVRLVTGSASVALGTMLLLFSAYSFINLQGLFFPDLLIAGAVLVALNLMESPRLGRVGLAGLGVLGGISPWIHPKATLMVATAAAIVGIRLLWPRRHWRDLAALVLPAVALLGLYEWALYAWHHVWLPNQLYVGQGEISRLFTLSPLYAIPAMLFDFSHGLLTYNPIFLLIVAGLPVWFRRNPWQLGRVLLVIVPTFLVNASLSDWWGGYGPPSRYLMEFAPALVPAIGLLIQAARRWWVYALIAGVVALQLAITAIGVKVKAHYISSENPNPVIRAVDRWTGWGIERVYPRLGPKYLVTGQSWLVTWEIFLLVLLGVGTLLAWSSPKRKPADG